MDARWHIELLGGLRATRGDQVLTRFRTQKTGALLAYLAYYPQRTHPRDHLIELLWPEADPAAGSNSLSQALSSLRRQLEPADVPPGTVLVANRASVRLNPAAFTTDVAEFEAALHAAASAGRDAERSVQLGRAVELYRGEFLAGSYERWVLEQREYLAESYFQALHRLLALLEQQDDLHRALECARRGVLADPLREEARRDLMRLYAAAGQPEAALRQYREMERLLKQELGTEPSAVTQALTHDIEQRDAGATCFPAALAPHDSIQAGGEEQPSVPPASARLPAQLTRFFGREEETARPRTMLLEEQRRLVTLTGPGGSGKTRLTIEVAGQLREPFGGAVWFVPLQDLADPRLILDKVLDILHLPRSPQILPLEQLVAFLSDRSALLLLDNFEHLVADGASLVQTLLERTEQLTVLVTSRRRLDLPGEREFPVLSLPIPSEMDTGGAALLAPLTRYASVQLFVDRAQAIQPDFQMTEANAAAVAALCARLEGLPLALELAAVRASVLTPAQILSRLSQRFDLLTTGARVTDKRHRSLRAALDWSYELLTPELQRFFARLSVFRGGWTLDASEAVCEEPRALEHLEQLRACSLVLAEAGGEAMRYRLLETLREYGAEQLDADERTALARRHARFYLELAEAAEPALWGADEVAWFDRLERELANIRAALDWTQAAEEEAASGLRLAGALDRFWDARCHWTEGRNRLEALLAAAGPRADPAARTKALTAAGWLASLQADHARASTLGEESLALARERDDGVAIAHSLYLLLRVAHEQGELTRATVLGEESLALSQALGDRLSIARSLGFLGEVRLQQEEYEQAARLCDASLALARELGSKSGIAIALLSCANVAWSQGENERVAALSEESLALFREVGDRHGVARVLYLLGSVAQRQGNDERAAVLHEASLALARELGNNRFLAECLSQWGRVAE